MRSRGVPGRRRAWRWAAMVLVATAILVPAAWLPYAGRFLAVQDPLERADVIYVLAGSRAERWLEGVELYKEGWAPRLLLSPGNIEPAESELRRRGIVFPAYAELVRNAMIQLGVPPDAVLIMPQPVDNTAHEAAALRQMALEAGWRRILVVTSKYHGRRARFAFHRQFRDSPVVTSVRTSRFDTSTPERWWRHRADLRYVTSELQKLLLYRLGVRE